MNGRTLVLAFVAALALIGCSFAGLGLGGIPGRPLFSSVFDGAGALSTIEEQQVAAAARAADAATGGEVVVVTVRRARDYGAGSVEALARRWFEAWRIGSNGIARPSQGKGVLLIVAIEDRAARIELGRGWSASAGSNARRIMDDVIVPHMRRGDIAGGIEAGTEALARLETRSSPAGGSRSWSRYGSRSGLTQYSAFSGAGFFGGGALALSLIVLGAVLRKRKIVALGAVLLLFIAFTKVVFALFVLALLAIVRDVSPRRRRGDLSRGRPSGRTWSSGRGASGRW